MIPLVKTRSVFTSRWKAILWALPILWFAYDIAGSMPSGDGNTSNAAGANEGDTAPSPDNGNTAGSQTIPAHWN